MDARNTFERPDALVPAPWVVVTGDEELFFTLPAKFVACLTHRLAVA